MLKLVIKNSFFKLLNSDYHGRSIEVLMSDVLQVETSHKYDICIVVHGRSHNAHVA